MCGLGISLALGILLLLGVNALRAADQPQVSASGNTTAESESALDAPSSEDPFGPAPFDIEQGAGLVSPKNPYAVFTERLETLTNEGKLEEAFLWAKDANAAVDVVRDEIRKAEKAGEMPRIVELTNLFFRHPTMAGDFPYGFQNAYWHSIGKIRADALKSGTSGLSSEQVEQELAARALFEQWSPLRTRDPRKATPIAKKIYEDYPGTVYAPPAAAFYFSHLQYDNARQQAISSQDDRLKSANAVLERFREARAPSADLASMLCIVAGIAGRSTDLEPALRLCEEAERIAPWQFQKAYALYRAGEIASDRYRRGFQRESSEPGRKLFERYLAQYPQSFWAGSVKTALIQIEVRDRQFERAIELAKRFSQEEPGDLRLGEAWNAIGTALAYQDREQAIAVFRETTERFPDSHYAEAAYSQLADLYEKTGREEEMLAVYQMLIEKGRAKAQATTPLGDVRVPSEAAARLAEYYMRQKRWEDAHRMWQVYMPTSWCGTCWSQMEAGRLDNIVRCLMYLKRHKEAVEVILQGSFEDPNFFFTQPRDVLLVYLVRMYQDAGQLNDLQRITSDLEATALAKLKAKGEPGGFGGTIDGYQPFGKLHDLLYVASLEEQKNIAALWEICPQAAGPHIGFHLSDNGYRAMAACLALMRLGDEAVSFWESYAQHTSATPGTWQILAMGLHPSPKVLPLLENLVQGDKDPYAWNRGQAYLYAIGLRGQEGREVLEKLLRQQPPPPAIARYGDQRLDDLLRSLPDLTWPLPEPGSLPTGYVPPPKDATQNAPSP